MMKAIRWIIVAVTRILVRVLLRVEVTGMERPPIAGPVILAINHINSIDGPLLRALLPRHIIGWAKVELWDNPILRILAQSLEMIPLRRGEFDIESVRLALQALSAGKMLGVAPEGTRSWHGRLQQGHPGIVLLALRAPEALILPAVIYGQERFSSNFRRLRRTEVKVSFGQGFYLDPGEGRVTREVRDEITEEIMAQIAALLPPEYRGVYSDLEAASERHLRFPPGTRSNLQLALDKSAAPPVGLEDGA